MSRTTEKPVELSSYAAGRLVRAMGTSFGSPVTAYLTDANLVAGCCIGAVHRHVRADANGRFQDGHRVRTSDVLEAHQQGEFWTLCTLSGSLYVIVTFKKEGGAAVARCAARTTQQGDAYNPASGSVSHADSASGNVSS